MRETLPPRRHSQTVKFKHRGTSWFCTVGFYPDGRVGEVFVSTAKSGTDVQISMRESAIAASIALQYGARLGDLAASLCGDHDPGPLGVCLAQLLPLEIEMMVWAAREPVA